MPAVSANPFPTNGSGPRLSYGAMRLRWCGWALLAFARRWGVYLVVTAAVVGAGSNSPVQAVSAVAAWLVLPLFWAAGQGNWLLPAWVAQVLLGLALLWGARALLWPPQWAEAERALPLRRSDTQVSDACVVSLALAPLWPQHPARLPSPGSNRCCGGPCGVARRGARGGLCGSPVQACSCRPRAWSGAASSRLGGWRLLPRRR